MIRHDTDPAHAYAAVEGSDVDVMLQTPTSTDLASALANHPDQVLTVPAPQTDFIGFDVPVPGSGAFQTTFSVGDQVVGAP